VRSFNSIQDGPSPTPTIVSGLQAIQQSREGPPVNEVPSSRLVNDLEMLADETRPVATSTPELEDPLFRVSDTSRYPDHEHFQLLVGSPPPKETLQQDLAPSCSQSPEEVLDHNVSLVPDPEPSKALDEGFLLLGNL